MAHLYTSSMATNYDSVAATSYNHIYGEPDIQQLAYLTLIAGPVRWGPGGGGGGGGGGG